MLHAKKEQNGWVDTREAIKMLLLVWNKEEARKEDDEEKEKNFGP